MPPPRAPRRPVPLTALQILWAAAALIGLVGVYWPALRVTDSAHFLAELGQSWSALTVSADLVLMGVPVVIFAIVESYRLGLRLPWIWAPLTIALPGAFVIPLFLLLRERALLRSRGDQTSAVRSLEHPLR
jgi:Terpene cyclase DEP1